MAETDNTETPLEDVIKRFETDYAAQKASDALAKAQADAEAAQAAAAAPAAVSEEPPAAAAAPEAPAAPQTYVVEAGDSLSAISLKVYGDAKYWTTIFEHNKDKISDPNIIHAGQELLIP